MIQPHKHSNINNIHMSNRDGICNLFNKLNRSFMGKLKIINNHFNNFQVHVATDRGSVGHFQGSLASKSMKIIDFFNLPLMVVQT